MKIHLIGVGGAAMGNLAAMLKRSGHTVTGSDHALYPPMSDRLKEWKIEAGDFDRKRIASGGRAKSALYIVGNAISRGNPEVEEALDLGLPLISMSQALYEFFLKGRRVQVVAGTHGKTTTTFLLHHILDRAGLKPGLFVGGIRADGHPGFAIPRGSLFAIEGDEYDTAFFDKGPKFLHYRPRDLILTHVEYDHADIYEDYEKYKRAFQLLLRWIPASGNVAAYAGSSGVREVMQSLPAGHVTWYGAEEDEGLLDPPSPTGGKGKSARQKFAGFRRDARRIYLSGLGHVEVPFVGRHNTANALAASLIARRLGVPARTILNALADFPGVLRRQQVRCEIQTPTGPVLFMEDFAHHPTAVNVTVEAIRDAFTGYRLIGLFEPRSATSHRNTFQSEYAEAFSRLDEVYLCDVFNRNKVRQEERLDVAGLVATLNQRGRRAFYAETPAVLLDRMKQELKRTGPMVILAMSNGGFGNIYPQIEAWLRSADGMPTNPKPGNRRSKKAG